MWPLLIMGCSQEKRAGGSMPIYDLYTGPIWQQIRKRRYPADYVAVVSAKHGILFPGAVIEPYDEKMTDQRLLEIVNDPVQFANFVRLVDQAEKAVIFGGETYKLFALSVVARKIELLDKVHFAGGSYLQQRGALNQLIQAGSCYAG